MEATEKGIVVENIPKAETVFEQYEVPAVMPKKGELGREEYIRNFKFAFNYLLSSGLSEEEVRKMSLPDMFSLAKGTYLEAKAKEAEVDKNKQDKEELGLVGMWAESNGVDLGAGEQEGVEEKGLWYEGIDKDLIKVVRPVFKYTSKEKTTLRPKEDVEADYRALDEAKRRLGEVYRNIFQGMRGMSAEDAKAYRISIEDACRLVFNRQKNVKSGMKIEQAEELLVGLGVRLSEKSETASAGTPKEVEKPEKRDMILSMFKAHISNEVSEKLIKEVGSLNDTELNALHATVMMLNDPELRNKHQAFWNDYSRPILKVLGVSVV